LRLSLDRQWPFRYLLIALAGLIVAGTVASLTAGYMIRASYAGFLQARIGASDEVAAQWAVARKREVTGLATHPRIIEVAQDLMEGRGAALAALHAELSPFVMQGVFLDAQIVARDLTVIGALIPEAVGQRFLAADQSTALQSVWQGEAAVSRAIRMPPVAGTSAAANAATAIFSMAPIRDVQGQVMAILALRLQPQTDFFRALVGVPNPRLTTYVLDDTGTILAATASYAEGALPVGSRAITPDGTGLIPPVEAMLTGGTGQATSPAFIATAAGDQLGASVWVREFGVGVLVTMPKAEAMALVHQVTAGIAALVLLAGAGTVWVWFVTNRFAVKLRVGRNLLLASFETTPDAYLVLDGEDRVIQSNRAFAQFFGWRDDEILGLPVMDLIQLVSDETGTAPSFSHGSGTDLILATARSRSGESLPLGVRFRDLSPYGRLLVFHDHRSIVEKERQLMVALDQANAASAAKSRFLSTISHELRSPIAGIVTALDMVAEETENDEHAAIIQSTQHASQLLLGIVEDMLDFSRMEAGKMELRAEVVDLTAVVADACDLLSWQASRAKVTILRDCDSSVPCLVGDGLRLRQILLNLVGNAIKFSSKSGRMGKVSVGFTATRDDTNRYVVEFRVEDNGIGMTEETISRIFLPFEQADNSIRRRYGGTGLGLSITQRIIDEMKGCVEVKSEPGVGSRFTVRIALPAAASERPGDGMEGGTADRTSHGAAAAQSGQMPRRLLRTRGWATAPGSALFH